jgi:hypothetical protein
MGCKRVIAVVICVGLVIAGRLAWTQSSVSAAAVVTVEPEIVVESDGVLLDRYGNEVETAIGDYRVDPLGEMYERHSPDTALPQLLPPTT